VNTLREHFPLQNRNIIKNGDPSGNGMVVSFRLPSGLEIFGLPTENFYSSGWDLGPTWNYAVMADAPFLVDAGRYGQGPNLLKAMEIAGIKPTELEFVLISHSHEDHDGGLAELVKLTELRIKAHTIYERLIRNYPDLAPDEIKKEFPAKCWHCPMPESYYSQNCLGYHRVLQDLKVEAIDCSGQQLGTDITVLHLPGHSPDSLAVILGEEAVIVGDILLPQITPWPTRLGMFDEIAGIIGDMFPAPDAIFGLQRYIRSLQQLRHIGSRHPEMQVYPAHRLFYNGQWNIPGLIDRIDELISHHHQRCSTVLDLVSQGRDTVDQIVERHFKPSLLKGFGKIMAANEIVSHCELLTGCGDLIQKGRESYEATGTHNFEEVLFSSSAARPKASAL
jgi:glyoxylase-like metal-dependent hydrolase (beta-lactamase superfamily II)